MMPKTDFEMFCEWCLKKKNQFFLFYGKVLRCQMLHTYFSISFEKNLF